MKKPDLKFLLVVVGRPYPTFSPPALPPNQGDTHGSLRWEMFSGVPKNMKKTLEIYCAAKEYPTNGNNLKML